MEDDDRPFRRPRDVIRVLVSILIVLTVIISAFLSGSGDIGVLRNVAVVSEEESQWDEPVDYIKLVNGLREGRPFEWNEWLNLNKTEEFHSGRLNPKYYPTLYNKKFENIEFPPKVTSTALEYAMLGRLFCEMNLVKPYRVVLLDDPANPQRRDYPQIYDVNETGRKCHKQYGQSDCSIQPVVMPESSQASDQSIDDMLQDLENDQFVWNPESMLKTDAMRGHASDAHISMIDAALKDSKHNNEHFHEVNLKFDPLVHGTHYDWRFFRGVAGYDERMKSLQSLSRAWAQFADTFGLTYWISHGSLLGWWWNGLIMPWDRDLDFQMPIQDLDRLAREFNGTLVVTDQREGANAFYIDVSPGFVQRQGSRDHNRIDARFIDISKGTYIDITALAYVERETRVECKSYHTYEVEDISPLRPSLFEGYPVMVPHLTEKILHEEYPNFDRPRFDYWVYNEKTRLWESNITCEEYLRRFQKGSNVVCPPTQNVPKDECDYTRFGTCNKYVLSLYNKTFDITNAHYQEREIWAGFEDGSHMLSQPSIHRISALLRQYHSPAYR